MRCGEVNWPLIYADRADKNLYIFSSRAAKIISWKANIADIPMRDAGCSAKRMMTERRALNIWRSAGVRLKSGAPLPQSDIPASLVEVGRRTFLTYPNYDAILEYNCAHLYALSVGMLADRLQ